MHRIGMKAAVLVALALAAPACARSETAEPVVVTTTTVPTTGGPAPTAAATTAPPVAPPTSVAADASTTITTTTTTTLPPTTTTTEPIAVRELLLQGDGLGAARFGAEAETVVDYVTSILGGNTGDTGWVDPFTFADCGAGGLATVARRVDWGVLSLLFTDGSPYAAGRRHFIGFEYGRVGQIGDEPRGLRTPGYVTLGSRVVDLLAEFPDAAVNEGDPELAIPDNFYVSDVFYGLLTGTTPEDVVTVLQGGYGCGE